MSRPGRGPCLSCRSIVHREARPNGTLMGRSRADIRSVTGCAKSDMRGGSRPRGDRHIEDAAAGRWTRVSGRAISVPAGGPRAAGRNGTSRMPSRVALGALQDARDRILRRVLRHPGRPALPGRVTGGRAGFLATCQRTPGRSSRRSLGTRRTSEPDAPIRCIALRGIVAVAPIRHCCGQSSLYKQKGWPAGFEHDP